MCGGKMIGSQRVFHAFRLPRSHLLREDLCVRDFPLLQFHYTNIRPEYSTFCIIYVSIRTEQPFAYWWQMLGDNLHLCNSFAHS